MNRLNYYFDKEADILYFSKGEPEEDVISQEAGDDVVVRIDPVTQEVVGFTILNFLKRASQKMVGVSVPLEARFSLLR